jgi:hypothetical protein
LPLAIREALRCFADHRPGRVAIAIAGRATCIDW